MCVQIFLFYYFVLFCYSVYSILTCFILNCCAQVLELWNVVCVSFRSVFTSSNMFPFVNASHSRNVVGTEILRICWRIAQVKNLRRVVINQRWTHADETHCATHSVPEPRPRNRGITTDDRFVPIATSRRVHAPVQESLYAHAIPVDEFATRWRWNDLDAYMYQITVYACGTRDHHGDLDRQFRTVLSMTAQFLTVVY